MKTQSEKQIPKVETIAEFLSRGGKIAIVTTRSRRSSSLKKAA